MARAMPAAHEKPLVTALAVLSALCWVGLAWLLPGAFERFFPGQGPLVTALLIGGIVILAHGAATFRKAGRVAFLLGHAVEIGPQQYPDLHARLKATCQRLQIEPVPRAFLYCAHPRLWPSFSLRFARRDYLALHGELVGALTEHQGAIDFFIGRELAQLRSRTSTLELFLLPALALPLLAPAWQRARVYAADRVGLAACKTKADAALALALLAAGSRRWKSLDIAQYAAQPVATRAFLPSFIELVSGTPWLSKRVARLRAIATGSETLLPSPHPLAWFAAAFVPYLAPRAALPARLVALVLWIVLLVLGAHAGQHLLVESGWLERLESRFVDRIVELGRPFSTGTPALPPAPAPAISGSSDQDAYASVDADFLRIGEVARARHKRHGGIPCELGELDALRLNFPAGRYALSCDEPVIYTMIETGEFEPGRPAHLRAYNWKEGRIVRWTQKRSASPED